MSFGIRMVRDWVTARRLAKEIIGRMRQVQRGAGFDLQKGRDQTLVAQALTIVLADYGDEWTVMDNRSHWTIMRRADAMGFDSNTSRQLNEAQIILPRDREVVAVSPVRVVESVDAKGERHFNEVFDD